MSVPTARQKLKSRRLQKMFESLKSEPEEKKEISKEEHEKRLDLLKSLGMLKK